MTFATLHTAFAPTMASVIDRWHDEYRYEGRDFAQMFNRIAKRLGGTVLRVEQRRDPLALIVRFPNVGVVRITYSDNDRFAVKRVSRG